MFHCPTLQLACLRRRQLRRLFKLSNATLTLHFTTLSNRKHHLRGDAVPAQVVVVVSGRDGRDPVTSPRLLIRTGDLCPGSVELWAPVTESVPGPELIISDILIFSLASILSVVSILSLMSVFSPRASPIHRKTQS
jgi:hypothetical protein